MKRVWSHFMESDQGPALFGRDQSALQASGCGAATTIERGFVSKYT
jgi:hypothetical protein